tara:strand:- start:31 stop:213 length:183 start_codon:yes stop_codon:yes gene_type:complete
VEVLGLILEQAEQVVRVVAVLVVTKRYLVLRPLTVLQIQAVVEAVAVVIPMKVVLVVLVS